MGLLSAHPLIAVIRYNGGAIEDGFRDLLSALGMPNVEALADKVDSLMERLEAPRRLSEVGVKAEDLPNIAQRGMGRSTAWNPRPMTEEDIVQLCKTIL